MFSWVINLEDVPEKNFRLMDENGELWVTVLMLGHTVMEKLSWFTHIHVHVLLLGSNPYFGKCPFSKNTAFTPDL